VATTQSAPDEVREAQQNGFVWVPVCSDPNSEDFDAQSLTAEGVYEMDLLKIPESKLFLRKANLKDFKKSVLNCKPTVNPCFLELYARFLQKYGHEDQKEFAEQMLLHKKPDTFQSLYA